MFEINKNEIMQQPARQIPWGTIINKGITWGSKYIEKLSKDLGKYGNGFSDRNLIRMIRFASFFQKKKLRHNLWRKYNGGDYYFKI